MEFSSSLAPKLPLLILMILVQLHVSVFVSLLLCQSLM